MENDAYKKKHTRPVHRILRERAAIFIQKLSLDLRLIQHRAQLYPA